MISKIEKGYFSISSIMCKLSKAGVEVSKLWFSLGPKVGSSEAS